MEEFPQLRSGKWRPVPGIQILHYLKVLAVLAADPRGGALCPSSRSLLFRTSLVVLFFVLPSCMGSSDYLDREHLGRLL
jgi:hypothetical protein